MHIPILVKPIVNALLEPFLSLPDDAPSYTLVDCTLGGGGHTQAFLEAFRSDSKLKKHRVLSFDQDLKAIEKARERFSSELMEGRLQLVHCPFSKASQHFASSASGRVLGLMADLGFSSDQIDAPERGLSFQGDGPLDMRMDPSRGISCQELLQQIPEDELERILREYGEERFSRRIACRLAEARRQRGAPASTKELRELVVGAIPPKFRHGRIHAATRTFQALRIAVNHEMEELDTLLSRVILEVNPGGRIAILSFHSLEDRQVKRTFRSTLFESLTKKPLVADDAEIASNPRSRSAKLRIATRLQ